MIKLYKIGRNKVSLVVWVISMVACDDFVNIDPPRNEVVEETVFTSDETALAAMNGVYVRMNGQIGTFFNSSLEVHTGLVSDELNNFLNNQNYDQIATNEIIPDNTIMLNSFWANGYQILDNANGVIEGLTNNNDLNPALRNQFLMEALFVRAYVHFYLVNLFGPVPYVTTTDLETNNRMSRIPIAEVYELILDDLLESMEISDELEFTADNSVRPTPWSVTALLARVYLYTEQWSAAEEMASMVINQGRFLLEDDLNEVFRATSREAIWQLVPPDGFTTRLGLVLPITSSGPGAFSEFGATALTSGLVASFSDDDARTEAWIGVRNEDRFPVKYKNSTGFSIGRTDFPEYVVMLRLAEQYLIRAEARAQQGNIPGAQQDLNSIRNRAGLPNTTATDQFTLLEEIMEERRRELFAEGGHRWLDLKRTGRATEVLAPLKPLWDPTDVLWPVPENEIFNNSNLLPQNPGY